MRMIKMRMIKTRIKLLIISINTVDHVTSIAVGTIIQAVER